MSILPIPGLDNLKGVVNGFLKIAVGLVDEVILAHAIRTRSENPYASAKEALVLYGQNAKPMLKNAAWLTLFTYGLSFLVFIIMLAPAAAVVYMIPGAWSAGGSSVPNRSAVALLNAATRVCGSATVPAI